MKFRFKIILLTLALIFAALAVATHKAPAAEWSTDPVIRKFFRSLVRPDNAYQSCCGEADSYFADQFEVDSNGDYIAIITDDREDEVPADNLNPSVSEDGVDTEPPGPHMRQHRAIGARVHVPAERVGCTKPNITGHGLLFMPQMGKSLQDGSTGDGIDHSLYDGKGDPIIPYCYCPPTMS